MGGWVGELDLPVRMNWTTAAESSRVWICKASFWRVSLVTSAACLEKKELFWVGGWVGGWLERFSVSLAFE